MKHFFCLLFLLALPACLRADGGLPTQPYIYVVGNAEIEKPADMVTLSFNVAALDLDQSKANKKVQAQANKVFALLKSAKIEDKDVEASDLKSEAEYEGSDASPPKHGKLTGYRVTRPFEVILHDIAIFPKLVDDLLALKVEEISGIEEGLSNQKEIEAQIWEKAIANARENADKTAKAAGMRVDSVFAISPIHFPDIQRGIFGNGEEGPAAMMTTAGVPGGDKEINSHYQLTPVTVAFAVHVIYLISPAK